jgi:protein-disulfide isomerase-like protein with CxxC motif
MGLADFFSAEAGQKRRRWLEESLGYYVPPELEAPLTLANMLNPVANIEDASRASQTMLAPDTSGWGRVAAAGDMATNIAAVVGPAAVAKAAGMPAYQAVEEGLLGMSSVPREEAARFMADEFGGVPVPFSGNETTAQEIARMLSSGRASEVTDEMMAKADPVEMMALYKAGATGQDMPMDVASRMARAEAMGFRDDVYHGTNTGVDFSNFGRSPYSKRYETYVAPESARDYANSYASSDQGRVMPLRANISGFHDGRTTAGREALKDLAYEKDFQPELYTNHLRGDPDTRRAVAWGDQKLIDELNAAGYPGAVIEERPWMSSYVVFDPTKLRSRFARFDPRLKHLSNLSAGIGALGLWGLMQPPGE